MVVVVEETDGMLESEVGITNSRPWEASTHLFAKMAYVNEIRDISSLNF